MANELLVAVKIGAALAGSFQSAFSSARGTVLKLDQTAGALTTRHQRLGEVMARAMSRPQRDVGALRQQYDQLGRTLDTLRVKQERLTASMARGEGLKAARSDVRGQAIEVGATALALGAPVIQSVRLAAGFQDQMRDTSITGEFSPAQEAALGAAVRKAALDWNQTQAEVARGTSVLVAGGIQDAKALERYAPVMAKTATATRASMDDLGSVALALKDNLQIGEDGFEGALNMLAYAGKRGQFEIKDMAKWLPALTPSFQALGVTGKEAVAEIGAALQIARKGAGTNDEAANNFKNFLAKLTSPDTLKDFEKAGIDLKGSMLNLRQQGLTPMQSMLEVITQYMTSKGPAASAEFQKAISLEDREARAAAMSRLTEAYKLGELFQDMQAMSFIRPAIANKTEMKDIKNGALGAADQKLLDADFQKRMGSSLEQFKLFKVGLMDLGMTIGDALLPALTDLLQQVRPAVTAFGEWAKANPGVVRGVVGLVGGLLAGKIAILALRYGVLLLLSPFTSMRTAATSVSAQFTRMRALLQMGQFSSLITGLRSAGGLLLRFGGSILMVGRFLVPFGAGLAMTVLGPLMLLGKGALFLGRIMAGSLLTGLKLAGQAVLWLGRALLLNPIGLAITGIATAAYLIYRYWEPIKGFFLGLWQQVKTAFDGGIVGISKLIGDWSPIGLFYTAFAAVLSYFGVDLPAKFSDAGGMIMDGLITGIQNKLAAAKESILQVGGNLKAWFAETLGIQSPSRVFAGFGDNIVEGLGMGIGRSAEVARNAVVGMAMAATTAWGSPTLAAPTMDSLDGGAGRTAGGQGMVITFAPQITIQGGDPGTVRGQVDQAMQFSFAEFERMMRRYEQDRSRASYGRNA